MDIKLKIRKLPYSSGVYFFKNKNGEIIYIGKANSLHNRVSSYFNKSSNLALKIKKMVEEINDIEYISTSSEIEAIVLERKMIKKNNPYYNTQLKDDKSFPFIRISTELDYPQILFCRKNKREKKKEESIYFGPFVDSEATRIVIKAMRQIFKIRGCKKKKLRKEDICLDYQIGLCSAPCAKLQEKKEYRKMVREVCLFLSGRQKKLVRDLYREMKNLSIQLDFEKAAKVRDKIKSIETIIKGQEINLFNYGKENNYILTKIDEKEKMEIEMGQQAILDLQQKLNLKKPPKIIEAFDISNIQGKLSVGSMIVFSNGLPKKKEYRRYRIKTVHQADDYAMLQEVIRRRYKRLISESGNMPDLILIDGGKGQLSAVSKIIKWLNLDLPTISIAKKEEEIFKPDSNQSIKLSPHSKAFFLIQRVRDEAHRFAITYHRKIRNKTMRHSRLDFIPGIGIDRKRRLLQKFKSIEEIKNASIEEISRVPGIGKKIAKVIKTVLEVIMITDFENKRPKINKSAFIAENATIIGDVTIGKNVSIWYNAVLRGDVAAIIIGDNTSIQDGSVIHCDLGVPTIVGKNVTVGHNVTLHACEIGNNSLIGIASTVLNGAVIGENSIIGAGAIVTPRSKIPAYSMALGIPAKVVKNISKEEANDLKKHAEDYIKLMIKYK